MNVVINSIEDYGSDEEKVTVDVTYNDDFYYIVLRRNKVTGELYFPSLQVLKLEGRLTPFNLSQEFAEELLYFIEQNI